MPRRQVEFTIGNYYHVYNRGNNRQQIFFEEANYIYFLKQLRHHLTEKGVNIVAYCLIPNHYHLLIYLQTDQLSRLMQSFTVSYTKAINKRYERTGSLFQGQFQAIHVNTTEYLLLLTRYIHLNPVEAGLVEKAEDWDFSSYQEYINLRNGTLPNLEHIRSQLPIYSDANVYRNFLEEQTKNDSFIQHLIFPE